MSPSQAVDERDKALDGATVNLKTHLGEGAIIKLGKLADRKVEAIPAGALKLYQT